MNITTVVCVYFDGEGILPDYSGGIYDWSWVEKLYRGIRDNSTIPFRFICLSDQVPATPHPKIQVIPLQDPSLGWMCINEIYRPDLGIERGLFMGLDTIITGDITHMLQLNVPFGVVRSPIKPKLLCNAVVSFNRKWANWLWHMWTKRKESWLENCTVGLGPKQKGYASEVVFLRHNRHEEWVFLDDLWPGQICSWKAHGVSEDTRILYFHGDQKPHQIDDPVIERCWA